MNLVNTLRHAWGATRFFITKNAPTILTVGGTVVTVAGTFFAAKGSLKLNELMAERQQEKEAIEAAHENGLEGYSDAEYKKNLIKCKTTTVKKLVKLYWPAAACTAVGVAGILSGHGMMKSRNAALAGTVFALERATNAYRDRVREAIGDEEEMKLSFPVSEFVVHDETVDPETGEVTVTEKKHKDILDSRNIYSVWWDESSYHCKHDPIGNLSFLKETQCTWNDILKRRAGAPVFLNEIMRDLDLEMTQVGQLAGWKYGDTIDFGVYSPINQDFIDGNQEECFLNFNCHGNVLDCLPAQVLGGASCTIVNGNED